MVQFWWLTIHIQVRIKEWLAIFAEKLSIFYSSVAFSRPHCGGNSYSIVHPISLDLGGMIEYFTPGRSMFHCHCPEGVFSDQCESCGTSSNIPRYQKSVGVCANCDCSDFSSSTRCSSMTGQCPCQTQGEGNEVHLAGRQCVSRYIYKWNKELIWIIKDEFFI